MDVYIKSADGTENKLPQLINFEFKHTLGEPCDSFSVSFAYEISDEREIAKAISLNVMNEGVQVFTGRIDEVVLTADAEGVRAELVGRGLAALLLDNEAEAAEYYSADLDFILTRHVLPLGIDKVIKKEMSIAPHFQIASGDSVWHVLREFCMFCGDTLPRFSPEGVLILDGSYGDSHYLSEKAPILKRRRVITRAGVISEVLVKSVAAEVTVLNDAFLEKGGSARRVINVPRYTSYDAMRHTAAWQIEQSEAEADICEITLPLLFAAFAGDIIEIPESALSSVGGRFVVVESVCSGSADGLFTHLYLKEL